uniref:SRCR domain-containing protein n=1 Tax=Amphimedon queenslandica TaxID=400682 RepID=A0A1X7V356_AMPQE
MRGDVHYYARAACSETNVTCTAGSVQVEESGLLKICTEGEWHTLCANNVTWTDNNAKSVCRELGHNPNGASPVLINANSSMEDRANISFHCREGEGMLSACTGTITDCTNINTIAGVKCGVTPVPVSDLMVTEITQSSVDLSWESVSNYDDSDHHYTINCTDNVTTLIKNVNGDRNENVIPNLSSGQSYTCCVYNVTNNDGVSRGTCLNFVTLSSESTENTSASGDSDFIFTSVVPWIGGVVIGAVVAVIIMSVIFVILRLVQQRKQGNLNDSAYNDYDNPDGSANEINRMERPHLESNASEGKTVINTLYDASLSLSASYVPTHDHTYSSLNELPPSD